MTFDEAVIWTWEYHYPGFGINISFYMLLYYPRVGQQLMGILRHHIENKNSSDGNICGL